MFRRAIKDILANIFLNVITIITIALSVLIVSAFILFFINTNAFMEFWAKGIRIMAYLKPEISEQQISDTQHKIQGIQGVADVLFISKKEALNRFKEQMKRQSSLLDNLEENPLPDAFEIHMTGTFQNWKQFDLLADQIEKIPLVEEVEYGQKWIEQFTSIVNLFRLTGYAMGCIFFMAAVFFVANTIRLVLYSREEEVEIMRLVGATESFIKSPFYIQSTIQGALGGMLGLGALFCTFNIVSGNWKLKLWNWNLEIGSQFDPLYYIGIISDFHVSFLSSEILSGILMGSIFVGWVGCYISLRQFLKL